MKVSRGESLDRYYIFKLFGFGVFVHRIHHSDPVDLFHSHPWSGLSIVFGGYTEYIKDPYWPCAWSKKIRGFNWITAKEHHRVEVSRPVWTLFVHLPKSNKWNIVNKHGVTVSEEPWEGEKGHKDYAQAASTRG